jgi:hypothetical protein
VVIGSIIALQINNTNELEKQRSKELHHPENIKTLYMRNLLAKTGFQLHVKMPKIKLKYCISLALRYHKIKQLRLLGA